MQYGELDAAQNSVQRQTNSSLIGCEFDRPRSASHVISGIPAQVQQHILAHLLGVSIYIARRELRVDFSVISGTGSGNIE